MLERIMIAGFGGQGVLFTGQLLAYAGMLEGKHVCWVPSYGAEMRGGTANCAVTVADEEICSPLAEEPGSLLIFNLPSLLKFAPRLKPGGILLLNSSLVKSEIKRGDVRVYPVPANQLAEKIKSAQLANLVMLGAYLKISGLIALDSVNKALEKILPAHRRHLLPYNRQALESGMAIVGG
ncbi:MAG: 2-oxoacid:acceptor oxidoreductase family protein [Bacillota bacterium]